MIQNIIDKMNEALGYELRAINMYAHYTANIKGIHRIHLSELFNAEVSESLEHSNIVRTAIVKLGGVCVTERNSDNIVHTENYTVMLEQALETEMMASKVYSELLEMVEKLDDRELYDSLENIYFSELRSVEGMRMLLD
ncbi:MAG TPA: ferritin-like domain-containing protein [Candidatus Poseidoniales archaeon]|nr:ferritin-like domain-containing protein [Candidatus Poseidoniales archaeon]